MTGTKRISIEQLKPGMFVVEMDLPWYRTPFLFHKRLIRDVETIAVMKQHGVQQVMIDPAKGLDVQGASASYAIEGEPATESLDVNPPAIESTRK